MQIAANSKSRTLGFTLVEILVCTAIIGIMFVSLYGGIASGFALVNLARENLRANQIILEKMEAIRLYSWDQINSNGYIPRTFTASFFPPVAENSQTNYNGSTSSSSSSSAGITYYGSLTITNAPVSDTYATNMRLVVVSLTWTNGKSARLRTMETLVSEYGMQNYIQ